MAAPTRLHFVVTFLLFLHLRALFIAEAPLDKCSGHPWDLDRRLPSGGISTSTAANLVHCSVAIRPKSLPLPSARPHVAWLLLIAGDVSLNPGPRNPGPRPICPRCCKPVYDNAAALQCDRCDAWLHRKCERLALSTYRRLSNCVEPWYCGMCQLPSFDDSLFEASSTTSRDIPTAEPAPSTKSARFASRPCQHLSRYGSQMFAL